MTAFLMLSCASKNEVVSDDNLSVEDSIPVINEIFYTVNYPDQTLEEETKDWPRITELKMAPSTEDVPEDTCYALVLDLTDMDNDALEIHISFNDFETESCYELAEIEGTRLWYWWNNAYIFSSAQEAVTDISAYVIDKKGNISDIYTFSVKGFSNRKYPTPISED